MGIKKIKSGIKRYGYALKTVGYTLPKVILQNAFTNRVNNMVLGKKKPRGASGKY